MNILYKYFQNLLEKKKQNEIPITEEAIETYKDRIRDILWQCCSQEELNHYMNDIVSDKMIKIAIKNNSAPKDIVWTILQ